MVGGVTLVVAGAVVLTHVLGSAPGRCSVFIAGGNVVGASRWPRSSGEPGYCRAGLA